MASICSDAVRYIGRAADLRGMVAIDAVLEEILKSCEGIEARRVDPELTDAVSVDVHLLCTPEAQALLGLIEEQVPERMS